MNWFSTFFHESFGREFGSCYIVFLISAVSILQELFQKCIMVNFWRCPPNSSQDSYWVNHPCYSFQSAIKIEVEWAFWKSLLWTFVFFCKPTLNFKWLKSNKHCHWIKLMLNHAILNLWGGSSFLTMYSYKFQIPRKKEDFFFLQKTEL